MDTFLGIRRKDYKWEAAGSLSRPLYRDWLRVIADYRYTRNDSNVENAATGVQIFDYDRHQATLSLAASF